MIFAADVSRFPSRAILVVGVIAAFAMVATGLGDRVDRMLDSMRVAASVQAPSERLVVVEMDAASVAAIRHWPWPRDHYAAVVDRLSKAGAGSITFDVDFSSAGTPDGDRRMAEALTRTNGIVALPTFAQRARSGETRSIDALPLPQFRPHVALTSVSMQPDGDGIVRRAPFGTVTAGLPRPSLSAYIAKRSGTADTFFPINFGIDPTRLPRLSFIAVRDGHFDAGSVRGRDVLIGATAIEMGDRYTTPHWGVLPGVIVQALATETLYAGVPVVGSPAMVILVAALLAMAILRPRDPRLAITAAMFSPIALFVAAMLAQHLFGTIYPMAPGLAVIGVASLGRAARHLAERFDGQRCIDEDTGLPNHRAMVRDLASQPIPAIVVGLVGNFDAVVALMGERAGHDMILRLADRLRVSGSETVYRLADRRIAVALSLPAEDIAGHMAGLQAILMQPIEILGRRTDAAVHLGVGDIGQTIEVRMANATRAANDAATRGVFWVSGDMDMTTLERRLMLMGELDHAIEAGQIEVHYQPKLDLAANRITSVEALVRWRHPDRGMIGPDAFIPLAEHCDRIAPLTLFIIGQVMRDLQSWRRIGIDISAAVNLSATLIALPAFYDAVTALLGQDHASPDRLIFEITESATLADPERAATILRRFRDQGVGISMDDYGTGQSTLSYLRRLPLSELKIDRSFVQHAHLSRPDALMVRSTIDLAHDLGLTVVAEGIEDEDCLSFLRDAGCDMAQGYLISRPIQAADLVKMLSVMSRVA